MGLFMVILNEWLYAWRYTGKHGALLSLCTGNTAPWALSCWEEIAASQPSEPTGGGALLSSPKQHGDNLCAGK